MDDYEEFLKGLDPTMDDWIATQIASMLNEKDQRIENLQELLNQIEHRKTDDV